MGAAAYYETTLTLQLFKNRDETQEKLRMNLHSLSQSVSELLEYGRKIPFTRYRIHVATISSSVSSQSYSLLPFFLW